MAKRSAPSGGGDSPHTAPNPLRPLARHRPGVRRARKGLGTVADVSDPFPPIDDDGPRPAMTRLERAEAQLAAIGDSDDIDDNAKWERWRLRAKARALDTNDTDYYCVVCFASRKQKNAFLRAAGWLKPDEDKFFWGPDIASHMGIALDDDRHPFHTLSVNERWAPYAAAAPDGTAAHPSAGPPPSPRKDKTP